MITLQITGWPPEDLTATLASLLEKHTDYSGVISARVVDSKEIRWLNRNYAGKDEPTDVLSFSYIEETLSGFMIPYSENHLGDVVLSRQKIKDQARAAGTDEKTEFTLLLLHGALHVLGYDHETRAAQQRVDRIQADLMKSLNLQYRNFDWQK